MNTPDTIPSGVGIEEMMRREDLNVSRQSDNNDLHIGPSSLDFHIAPEKGAIQGQNIVRDKEDPINLDDKRTYPGVTYLDRDPIRLEPNEFALATTDEYFELDKQLMGFMHGRSSIGRVGLFIENAGLIDRGFEGQLTLELFNATANVIEIPAFKRVGQIAFFSHDYVLDDGYDGKYNEQESITSSRGYRDEN